jgi:hypothetical protein
MNRASTFASPRVIIAVRGHRTFLSCDAASRRTRMRIVDADRSLLDSVRRFVGQFYWPGHTLPISAAIKMTCRIRRGAIGMTGLCEIARCSRAAFTLAGNRQQSIMAAIPAAHNAILGIWSPVAIAISAKPVIETHAPAFPSDWEPCGRVLFFACPSARRLSAET